MNQGHVITLIAKDIVLVLYLENYHAEAKGPGFNSVALRMTKAP